MRLQPRSGSPRTAQGPRPAAGSAGWARAVALASLSTSESTLRFVIKRIVMEPVPCSATPRRQPRQQQAWFNSVIAREGGAPAGPSIRGREIAASDYQIRAGKTVTITRGHHIVAEMRPARRRTGADLRTALDGIPPPDERFASGIAGAVVPLTSEGTDPWAGATPGHTVLIADERGTIDQAGAGRRRAAIAAVLPSPRSEVNRVPATRRLIGARPLGLESPPVGSST